MYCLLQLRNSGISVLKLAPGPPSVSLVPSLPLPSSLLSSSLPPFSISQLYSALCWSVLGWPVTQCWQGGHDSSRDGRTGHSYQSTGKSHLVAMVVGKAPVLALLVLLESHDHPYTNPCGRRRTMLLDQHSYICSPEPKKWVQFPQTTWTKCVEQWFP